MLNGDSSLNEEKLRRSIAQALDAAHSAGEFRNETYLAVLLAALLRSGGDSVPMPGESALPQTSQALMKAYSAPEYFSMRNYVTDQDKVVLAGYFLERYSQLKSYGVTDVKKCLVSAKVSPPNNPSLAIFKSVQKGWLMEVPSEKQGMKAYSLTQTGERRAEGMFKAGPQA